jgi:hypothetical protein
VTRTVTLAVRVTSHPSRRSMLPAGGRPALPRRRGRHRHWHGGRQVQPEARAAPGPSHWHARAAAFKLAQASDSPSLRVGARGQFCCRNTPPGGPARVVVSGCQLNCGRSPPGRPPPDSEPGSDRDRARVLWLPASLLLVTTPGMPGPARPLKLNYELS